MNNKVNTEQMALLLMIVVPVGKYLSLPSLMAKSAGRDYWLSILFLFILDFICFLFILLAVKLNEERLPFNVILNKSIGRVAAKIIFVMMFLFSFLRAATVLESCLAFFSVTFAIKTNWLAYIIPIAGLSMFMARKGMNNIGRLTEILFVIISLSLGIILFMASKNADFSNIKPILDDGLEPVFKTAMHNTFWFSDYCFIIYLMRDYKPNKKFVLTTSLAYISAIAVTVFMNVLYISLFDQLTVQSQSVMSKVSQFSVKATTTGRVDWLFLSIWLFTLFIKLAIQFFCCNKCLHYIFDIGEHKNPYWTNILVATPMLILPLYFPIKDAVFDLFSRDGYGYVFWILQYGLPPALPVMTYFVNKREKARVIYPRRFTE